MAIENIFVRRIINEVFQNRPPVHDRVVYYSGEELKDWERVECLVNEWIFIWIRIMLG